jgi:hypothetical protein
LKQTSKCKYCLGFLTISQLLSNGVSEGAKVEPIEVFAAYCEELSDISDGCTDIIAMPDSTKFHETLIGHTNDESSSQPVLIRTKTPDQISAVGISLNGIGYSVGFNSMGISLTGNQLEQKDVKEGIPRLVIFGEMMRAPSFEDAVKIASHPRRASSYNNIIATPKHLVSLEGSGKNLAPIVIKSGLFAHSNHYISKEMSKKVENKSKEDLIESKSRLKRAAELLSENDGKHTIQTFKTILSDHESEPRHICSHKEDKDNVETVFAVIVQLEKRKLHYTTGRPCSSVWYKLTF